MEKGRVEGEGESDSRGQCDEVVVGRRRDVDVDVVRGDCVGGERTVRLLNARVREV